MFFEQCPFLYWYLLFAYAGITGEDGLFWLEFFVLPLDLMFLRTCIFCLVWISFGGRLRCIYDELVERFFLVVFFLASISLCFGLQGYLSDK